MTAREAMDIVLQKKNELADAIEGLKDALHNDGKLDDALGVSFDFYVCMIEDLTDEVMEKAKGEYYGHDEEGQ